MSEASLYDSFIENAASTRSLFLSSYANRVKTSYDTANSQSLRLAVKLADEYEHVRDFVPKQQRDKKPPASSLGTASLSSSSSVQVEDETVEETTIANETDQIANLIDNLPDSRPRKQQRTGTSTALVLAQDTSESKTTLTEYSTASSQAIMKARDTRLSIKPTWHAPWKLMRVIAGHTGWVRCVAVDASNEWFATGSTDKTVKIWDLASGTLKLTLTGHINTIRAVAVSARHPYLFSVGEDKLVKCWDLEQNKVVRSYHGHLSGVYCCAVHPTLDLLVTGGRDSVARVWDMRSKIEVKCLSGHANTVGAVFCNATDPQIVTGSYDSTIKCWDLIQGRPMATLTHHKKSVRALALHPNENTFASGAPDHIKVWKMPECDFMRNVDGHNSIINSLCINNENVMVAGGDNGTLSLFDWKSGYKFQEISTPPQPGSLEAEAGIFGCTFDQTGSRLITVEADKSIKIYKEQEDATEETHPIDWKAPKRKRY